MLNYFLSDEKNKKSNVKTEQQKMKIYQKISDKIFLFNSSKPLKRECEAFHFNIPDLTKILTKYIALLQSNTVRIEDDHYEIYSVQYKDMIVCGQGRRIFYNRLFSVKKVDQFTETRDDEFFQFIEKFQFRNIDEYILRYFANQYIHKYLLINDIKIISKKGSVLHTNKGTLSYEADYEKIRIFLNKKIFN